MILKIEHEKRINLNVSSNGIIERTEIQEKDKRQVDTFFVEDSSKIEIYVYSNDKTIRIMKKGWFDLPFPSFCSFDCLVPQKYTITYKSSSNSLLHLGFKQVKENSSINGSIIKQQLNVVKREKTTIKSTNVITEKNDKKHIMRKLAISMVTNILLLILIAIVYLLIDMFFPSFRWGWSGFHYAFFGILVVLIIVNVVRYYLAFKKVYAFV